MEDGLKNKMALEGSGMDLSKIIQNGMGLLSRFNPGRYLFQVSVIRLVNEFGAIRMTAI